MNEARLAILVAALASLGCYVPRWPTQSGLAPSKAYVRYVALALKRGDDKCFEASTGDDKERAACNEVYSTLKRELLKLEEEP